MAVTNCNIDMESLIADPNRSIATLVREVGGCADQLQDVDVQLVHRRHPAAHKEASAHALVVTCQPRQPFATPPHPTPARPSPRYSRQATSPALTACSSRLAAS